MIVSLKNIYKSFKNKKVFENFSLEIGENEKVAIIGKTCLLYTSPSPRD